MQEIIWISKKLPVSRDPFQGNEQTGDQPGSNHPRKYAARESPEQAEMGKHHGSQETAGKGSGDTEHPGGPEHADIKNNIGKTPEYEYGNKRTGHV